MKMEADLLKLNKATVASTTTNAAAVISTQHQNSNHQDTGGLTFGPAWLRQLSSGDINKTALPPSPSLTFQLSKHRYSREEMLAIYETIEKSLGNYSPPHLAEEFEELYRKDLQRPVLLIPPSLEEQKFLSTCVNSQVVLNSYNKIQGQPNSNNNSSSSNHLNNNNITNTGGNNSTNVTSTRGVSNNMRGGSSSRGVGNNGNSSGGGGRGGVGLNNSTNERGGGRGRGRGRGTSDIPFKAIDEEGLNTNQSPQVNSIRGIGANNSSKSGTSSYKGSSYNSRAGNSTWEERELNTSNTVNGLKKDYSRAMTDDNWRNRAATTAETDNSEQVSTSSAKSSEENSSSSLTTDVKSLASSVSSSNSTSQTNNETSETNNNNKQKIDSNNSEKASVAQKKEWRNSLTSDKQIPSTPNTTSSSRNNEWTLQTSNKKSYNNNNNTMTNISNTYSSTVSNNLNNSDRTAASSTRSSNRNSNNPEWFNDDDEENAMTFDDSGKFISIKELKNKKNSQEDIKQKRTDTVEEDKNKPEPIKQKQQPAPVEKVTTQQASPPVDTKPQVDTSKNITQSDSIVNETEAETNFEQQQQQQKMPMISSLNILKSNENILMLQQQLKLKQQIEDNLSNQQRQLNEFATLQQNSSVDPILLAAAAAQNNLLLNKLNPNQQITYDNLQQLQQQLASSNAANMDPKRGAVGLDHPDADKWFYLDPQNQIQGSFSSEQMAGWFAAGYFTLNLMIKRGCDDKFIPLGVVSNNWGRIPFITGPQPPIQQQQQPSNQWSSEQVMQQQIKVLQRLQQMQLQFPQNINLPNRNDLIGQQTNSNTANINTILQQLQQLQLQQQQTPANTTLSQDLRSQQEALISQFLATNKQNVTSPNSMPNIDPAILGTANQTGAQSSIWGDMANGSRISPPSNVMNTSPPIPLSISPINNLLQQQQQSSKNQLGVSSFAQVAANLDPSLLNSNTANLVQQIQALNNSNSSQTNLLNLNNTLQMLNDNNIKDKIQQLFEQTKKEEERRRKQEEFQHKLKREEEDNNRRLLEELRLKQQQEEHEHKQRMHEEERVRMQEELVRKEQQRKKLEEIIQKQEEEKKKSDELKKRKEEETKAKQKEDKIKQKQKQEEQKKLELQQQEETEKRQQQQLELSRKQAADLEKQKLKYQQEQLNNLQLPAHANWAKTQPQQQQTSQQNQLKSILEQQALESMQQRLLEQQKQADLMAQQNSQSSSWSSLFRGNQQQLPTAAQAPLVSLATIQAEQTKVDSVQKPATMSQKIQSTVPVKQTAKQQSTTWASWGNNSKPNETVVNGNSNGGFWTELSDPKKTKNAKNSEEHSKANSKHAKKVAAIEESVQQAFLRNLTISDEFMKWCHEQLKDFHVELHIPTFVNFLREIETCNEIEEYVINYLGDSQQAKDFAHQFYINRESQIKQQSNIGNENSNQMDDLHYSNGAQFSKQKQKKRSKGQRVDHQLLGFTVQPDPNLKNRGDIDPL